MEKDKNGAVGLLIIIKLFPSNVQVITIVAKPCASDIAQTKRKPVQLAIQKMCGKS